ncbi:hypothetical protein [Vreelandella titanicae]|uniref:hypothetical protein n=1 Tax=Vreelandella titanicae TaxID=664683 RepID=UPI001593819A|nr:hypothetical protein [Halomonas titanicae]NVE90724.1 hypothetical protein [Halomonas titanicae]
MEIVEVMGKLQLKVRTENGSCIHINIDYLTKVKGWESFSRHAINYCTGKKANTIKAWWGRLNSVLRPTINESNMEAFPKKSVDWSLFIKNLYLTVLITTSIRSSVYTRVAIWNKNIYPFLVYLQDRDEVPIETIIPLMKQVDQVHKRSSFNESVIGENAPFKIDHRDHLDKLISPVSLSRTDSAYLDEIYYDLERKRNVVHRSLTDYWKTIKSHFEFGQILLSETDLDSLVRRVSAKECYDLYPRDNAPPFRRHFTSGYNRESLAAYLCLSKHYKGYVRFSSIHEKNGLACRNAMYANQASWESLFPDNYLEEDNVSHAAKLNWMLGLLGNIDISFIVALLMMENPKFTFYSLLNCHVEDKDGKSLLEVGENSITFTIEKSRAKSLKKEELSDLSLDIISTLLEMRSVNLSNMPVELSRYLFVIIAKNSSDRLFISPQMSRVAVFLSGRDEAPTYLGTIFPSLKDAGVSRNTLTHSKLRATEGVLEYFRTGSIRAVSRKLGNGSKVTLEHYLPKPLIDAYNTRQVRRFQNLLIVSACAKEDYLLSAVDFNSLNELHSFILNMIALDSKGINPLINILKDKVEEKDEIHQGDLIANISESSLSILYAYKIIAEKGNLSAAVLAKFDVNTGLAPIAFITLAKHLNNILTQHAEKSVREINILSNEKAWIMAKNINWDSLIMTKANL